MKSLTMNKSRKSWKLFVDCQLAAKEEEEGTWPSAPPITSKPIGSINETKSKKKRTVKWTVIKGQTHRRLVRDNDKDPLIRWFSNAPPSFLSTHHPIPINSYVICISTSHHVLLLPNYLPILIYLTFFLFWLARGPDEYHFQALKLGPRARIK